MKYTDKTTKMLQEMLRESFDNSTLEGMDEILIVSLELFGKCEFTDELDSDCVFENNRIIESNFSKEHKDVCDELESRADYNSEDNSITITL